MGRDFYSSERIHDNLICIRSLSGELLYLLEGDTKCALIDSCFGVGHLREYVESLTKKPVTLFLTHGHVDHAMGAPQFDKVYLHSGDRALYQKQCSIEEREGYARAALGEAAKLLTVEDYVLENPRQKFEKLEQGMVFDFTPFHLEAYGFPGHTKGSMVFLIREMNILILGDACNNATFLFDEHTSTLREYQKTVQEKRAVLEGRYNRVFTSHHVMEGDADILDQVAEVCEDVLEGKADDIPFEFMGHKAYIAKKCNQRFEREDGKFGNIIYSRDRL